MKTVLSFLKKISVIFYLKSLCPMDVPVEGLMKYIAVETDPTPAWLAIPGLLLVSAGILLISSWQVRRMQISYTE